MARRPPEGIDDYVRAGEAVQRFWLTATRLGLQLQPQYTPLVFAEYVRRRVEFTSVRECAASAPPGSNGALRGLLGEETAPATVFLGRLGYGPPNPARSLAPPPRTTGALRPVLTRPGSRCVANAPLVNFQSSLPSSHPDPANKGAFSLAPSLDMPCDRE